jgi:hypothetical protein
VERGKLVPIKGYAQGVLRSARLDAKKEKDEGLVFFVSLDFSFVQHRSEAFSTTVKESDCEFGSLATLVFSASHLPGLLRSTDFFLTLGTFSHNIPFLQSNVRSG